MDAANDLGRWHYRAGGNLICQVSFIVIAHNAERTISSCIESILRQGVDKHIIVVDNNSQDRTVDQIPRYGVEILFEPVPNRGRARNRGLEAAIAPYVAFVDADVELPTGWAREALRLLECHPEVVAVGGPGIRTDASWVSRVLNEMHYGISLTGDGIRHTISLPTLNIMYRGVPLAGMRFADLWTAEDSEFNFRLLECGWTFLWCKGLAVVHKHPLSLLQLASKSFDYGKWYLAPYWRHPGRIDFGVTGRVVHLPIFILLLLVSLIMPWMVWLALAWLIVPVLAYMRSGLRSVTSLTWRYLVPYVVVHSLRQYAQIAGIWAGLLSGNWRDYH